ncbi:Oca5 protein [Saccharomycopsis crataegensis]|uniref:Oca5 protein n=1 Tax=Saccharomycopsis crataegensis TaxID=43959 RepID=A0AAV5QWB8_9ASCO|nr:Oca5 protein [Saccharomycopsis crataegensis]
MIQITTKVSASGDITSQNDHNRACFRQVHREQQKHANNSPKIISSLDHSNSLYEAPVEGRKCEEGRGENIEEDRGGDRGEEDREKERGEEDREKEREEDRGEDKEENIEKDRGEDKTEDEKDEALEDEDHSKVLSLIKLCCEYIKTENVEALALIARQKGVPPFLRYRIWPMLLKKHSFVVDPYINPNFDEFEEEEEEEEAKEKVNDENKEEDANRGDNNDENTSKRNIKAKPNQRNIPIKQIRSDLKRYYRKNIHQNSGANVLNGSNNSSYTKSDPYHQLSLIEKRIFKTLEYSIVKFLRKWGSIFKYESGLAWIALGLAEWYPPLLNNKHYTEYNDGSKYVLLGKDMCLAKFEKIHKGKGISKIVDTNSNPAKSRSNSDISLLNSTNPNNVAKEVEDSSDTNSTTSTFVFDQEKIYFDDCNLSDTSCIVDVYDECNIHYDNFLTKNEDLKEFDKEMKLLDDSIPLKYKLSFPEIFERLVLVILHAPEPSEEELNEIEKSMKKTDLESSESLSASSPPPDSKHKFISESIISLPVKGASIDERVSFFLYLLRKVLDELSSFFKEEGVLTSSYNLVNNGDEWLLWWIKWCGAKTFNKMDRGRLWDLVLGWRPFPLLKDSAKINLENVVKQISETDQGLIEQLGGDIYWNAVAKTQDHELIKTVKSLLVLESTNEATSDIAEESTGNYVLSSLIPSAVREKKFSYSCIDPHIEILFIYLAFLKSHENLIFELDQAEIRQFLNNGLMTTNFSNRFAKKKASKSLKSQHKSYVAYGDLNPKNEAAGMVGKHTSSSTDNGSVKSPEALSSPVNNLNLFKSPIASPQPNVIQMSVNRLRRTSFLSDYHSYPPNSLTPEPSPKLDNIINNTDNDSSQQNYDHSAFVLPPPTLSLITINSETNTSKSRSNSTSTTSTTNLSPLMTPMSSTISAKLGDKKDKSLPLVIDKNNDDIEDVILRSANFWKDWLMEEIKFEKEPEK